MKALVVVSAGLSLLAWPGMAWAKPPKKEAPAQAVEVKDLEALEATLTDALQRVSLTLGGATRLSQAPASSPKLKRDADAIVKKASTMREQMMNQLRRVRSMDAAEVAAARKQAQELERAAVALESSSKLVLGKAFVPAPLESTESASKPPAPTTLQTCEIPLSTRSSLEVVVLDGKPIQLPAKVRVVSGRHTVEVGELRWTEVLLCGQLSSLSLVLPGKEAQK